MTTATTMNIMIMNYYCSFASTSHLDSHTHTLARPNCQPLCVCARACDAQQWCEYDARLRAAFPVWYWNYESRDFWFRFGWVRGVEWIEEWMNERTNEYNAATAKQQKRTHFIICSVISFTQPSVVGECAKRVRRAVHTHRSEKVNTKWKNREPKKTTTAKFKRHPCIIQRRRRAVHIQAPCSMYCHRHVKTFNIYPPLPCRIIVIIIIDLLRAHFHLNFFFVLFLRCWLCEVCWFYCCDYCSSYALDIQMVGYHLCAAHTHPNRQPRTQSHAGKQQNSNTIMISFSASTSSSTSLYLQKSTQKWMAARRSARNPFLLRTHVPPLRFVRRKECEYEWNRKNGFFGVRITAHRNPRQWRDGVQRWRHWWSKADIS